jgi:hypothetical protein
MLGQQINDGLERIKKEEVWPNLRYYPRIILEGQRKTTKILRIVCIPVEIGTGYLPNTSQER